MLVITVRVEKRYGPSGAMTVREAVERYGSDAKLVVPVEPAGFFAAEEPRRSVAGLESARSGERVTA